MRQLKVMIALTTALLLATTPAANAFGDTSTQDAELIKVVEVPMEVIGYDAEVAAANGFTIAFDDKGTPYSIPDSGIVPFGVVTGNCGSAWATIVDAGDRKYRVTTGFGVNIPAISYNWKANVIGPNYNKTHSWSGGLLFRSAWSATVTAQVPTNAVGWYSVVATGSATLNNGLVCGSMKPVDNEPIY